jgi:hypothetical protein
MHEGNHVTTKASMKHKKMEEQCYLEEWELQDGLSIRLYNDDEHRACYLKPKEGPMRVQEPNGNLRSQIQNIVTCYTYASLCMHQGGKTPSEEREKKEKKTQNMRMWMRKSRSVCHDIYIFQHYMIEFTRRDKKFVH